MTSYKELLARTPESSSVDPSYFRGLLSEVDLSLETADQLDNLAGAVGVSPQVIADWARGDASGSWRDLSALALALDRHPIFVRRVAREGTVHGPWYITRAAVEQYRSILGGGRDYDEARDELALMAQDTIQSARIPRQSDDGAWVYRGPKPLRLNMFVRSSSKPGDVPALVAVRPTHDGIHVTIRRGSTLGYSELDYRNWLGAWLCRAFNASTSVSVGDAEVVFGFDPRLLETAWSEYRGEVVKGIHEAGTYLLNAVASWKATSSRIEPRAVLDRHANEARVASMRVIQTAQTHSGALHLELSEEAAVRRLAESDAQSWHQILEQYHDALYVCGRRLADARCP